MTSADDFSKRFATHLEDIADRRDRGALAALRRGLGKPPGTAPEMYPYVAPLLGANRFPSRERSAYLIASLFGSHPMSAHDGSTLTEALLRTKRSASYEKRVLRLLSSDSADLGDQLRHIVAFLRAENVLIDWAQLFYDIERWDHPDRWIQRRWAHAYWGMSNEHPETETGRESKSEQGGEL